MRVRILVLPVYRRAWLYHAWLEGVPEPTHEAWWKAGGSWTEKFSVLQAQMNSKMNHFVSEQWTANAAAKEGTFRHWMHKLALGVMSREDPVETFLKRVPRHEQGQPMSLEIMFPSSLDPVLVRRRLRHVALRNTRTHRRALYGWGLACIPQIPLTLTPLPNVTLYYSVYRLVSHYRALGGATTMTDAFNNPESQALQRAVEAFLREDGGNPKARKDSRTRPGRLGELTPDQRLEALLERLGGAGTLASRATGVRPDEAAQDQAADSAQYGQQRPVVAFVRSQALEDAVQPLERWHTPLGDSALAALSRTYRDLQPDLSGLDEHLARVRRMALEQEAKRDTQRSGQGRGQQDAGGVTQGPQATAASSAGSTDTGRAAQAAALERTLQQETVGTGSTRVVKSHAALASLLASPWVGVGHHGVRPGAGTGSAALGQVRSCHREGGAGDAGRAGQVRSSHQAALAGAGVTGRGFYKLSGFYSDLPAGLPVQQPATERVGSGTGGFKRGGGAFAWLASGAWAQC